MKKQILFLTFFVLALIAGTSTAFGQELSPSEFSTVPRILDNCVGTPQQPKAGVPYIYRLDNPTDDVSEYRFWATHDRDFISGDPTVTNQDDSLQITTGELLEVSDIYFTPGTTNEVEITWAPSTLANTVYQSDVDGENTFVVGLATGDCANNIKIWEIDPSPSFTVDIVNIDPATEEPLAYDATTEQCVDETRAAKYDPTSNGILYNYGWDTLYFEVIAANFVEEWTPTFFLTGLGDASVQEATVGWASTFAEAQAGTFIESGDITGGSITGTEALASSLTNTNDGVSLYVRVVIANNNYETLAIQEIDFSVAGEDTEGFDITDDEECTQPTTAADAAADDLVERTINPRPTIQEGTPIILPNEGTTAP
jgi:hypothetical protein